MLKGLLYRMLKKYETQLQQIKNDPCRLKMKESRLNKLGQVLYLHFNKWRNDKQNEAECETNKTKEVAYPEKYIGQMGTKSAIELTKPFGFDYLTEIYLRDYLALRQEVLRRLPLGAEILDLGCGGGWLSIFLAYEGYNVEGVEISPLLVEIAQKRWDAWPGKTKCQFLVGDIEDIALNKKFDMVIIYEALHHTNNPDKVISNAANHCKSGGYILLKEPNLIWSVTGVRSAFINENTERGFAKKYLKTLLKNNGFSNIKSFKNKFGYFVRDIHLSAKKV